MKVNFGHSGLTQRRLVLDVEPASPMALRARRRETKHILLPLRFSVIWLGILFSSDNLDSSGIRNRCVLRKVVASQNAQEPVR